MSDRPAGTPKAPARRARQHRVAAGQPAYRAVRSPLMSMGPSLVEARRRAHRRRRGAALSLLVIGAVALIVAGIVILSREVVTRPVTAAPVTSVAFPTGRPEPRALTRIVEEPGEPGLRLQLPINRRAITAIGYDTVKDPSVLALEPEGRRSNLSWGARVFRRFLATKQPTVLRYYMLRDSGQVRKVNVGAAPGTEVYAPISGTIIAIADNVIDGETMGVVVQLQPLGDAETVVVLRNIDLAEGVAVGQTVSEGTSLVAHVRDMTDGPEQSLSRYTHDAGSNLEIYVRRVAPDNLF